VSSLTPALRRGQGRRSLADRTIASRGAAAACDGPTSRPDREEPRHDDHRWPSPPDPGDLSRRVAQRRAELHLSQGQVAARAGLSLHYLEYLERYPARPTPAALR
jgi:Helix-turn-helix domain